MRMRERPKAQEIHGGATSQVGSACRVNAVSPDAIDTPGLNELLVSSETGQHRGKMIAATVPPGLFGRAHQIVKAVVFLAFDDSSYVTGIELFVDGGFAQA
jgi:NAD(P)-dependent dehydrogenase (short-subunit alcohol dehydrogenase family)